jgi:RHS repeat-associated protein
MGRVSRQGMPWQQASSKRRAVAAVLAIVMAAAGLIAIVTAGSVLAAASARASSVSVLILSTSVNGGSSSAEAQAVTAVSPGASVTVDTPSSWDALSESGFEGYSAIIIGDPSSGGSCATTAPSDAVSTESTWGPAVTGNVAVLGTAPALADSAGTTLMDDAVRWALSGSGTGLYVSLNCDYAGSSVADADATLLDHVSGGGFDVTGQNSQGASCSDSGTVNTWEADNAAPFTGLGSSALSASSWTSPACAVQETFNSWPANFTPVAYDAAASPASFTASDGVTGQPYVLAGTPTPSAAVQANAPTQGGAVLAGTTSGGGSNSAASGITQDATGGLGPVDTEDGDFTQSDTDLSIATFGPGLDFTRTYDAQVAEQQTRSSAPGPLGYGWTDDWATSLSTGNPVPGDIYSLDGLATNTGNGSGASMGPLDYPDTAVFYGGNVYIVDTAGNRVEEVPGNSGSQWGISMSAGDTYTIAGSPTGAYGDSANGVPNEASGGGSLLNAPGGLAFDSAGDLYIADSGNNRVLEIPVSTGTQRGVSMSADEVYTVAGNWGGSQGHSGDGGAATSAFLNDPVGLAFNTGGSDLYVADAGNNRVQEVAGESGTQWGASMSANDIYTITGSPAGTAGATGDGGTAGSALLSSPQGLALSSAGDLYIADTANNRIQEVPAATGTQWGTSMTGGDIYTVAGSATGNAGMSGDGGAATSALLDAPASVVCDNGTQLYIADSGNNRVQEVARTTHSEWGISMTTNDVYTIAGSAAGTAGFSGDGGAATSALLHDPGQVALDGTSDLWIADTDNNRVREVQSSSGDISEFAGDGQTLASAGNGGPAVDGELFRPAGEAEDADGNVYIADAGNNRIQEIAATDHTQWGITMYAGDVYTVAGSAYGLPGDSGDGGAATSALLNNPYGIAVDLAGNLYIADQGNNRIQQVSAATGDISTIAGSATGTDGDTTTPGPATSALLSAPDGVAVDAKGDVYIADSGNNRVEEIFASGGQSWGQTMTAGDIYTVAGSATGTSGLSGDGGLAASALLDSPQSLAFSSAGNLYIGDTYNCRVQEIPATTGSGMTRYDIYTIAGSPGGTCGSTGDGGPALDALLSKPAGMATDANGDLYIADGNNDRIQEIPAASGTQWGQAMTTGDMYTVAGNGTKGESGDGGPATSAEMSFAVGVSVDSAGNLYIADWAGNHLREVTSSAQASIIAATGMASSLYPAPGSTTSGTTYPGGITVTQPGDAQITFYTKPSGSCATGYITDASGTYCIQPQDEGASLTWNSGTRTWSFTPDPGDTTYTYASGGALANETDTAGDTLTATYGSPAPGSGNCPATASSCETITGANGRTIVIGSNSSFQVTSATDPMGREWTYGYNSDGDLTSATDPMGDVTTYAYGQGSTGNPLLANDLLTTTGSNAQPGGPDAGEDSVDVYNSAGQVTSETDPMGYTTTFNYCASAAAQDCMNRATGNGVVTITDPDGNKTVDTYDQGTLAAEADWTGTALTSENDNIPDTTTGTLYDTATFDGDQRQTTYAYNPTGYATQTTSPDGIGSQTATTTSQYTALDNASCDGNAQAATPCSGSETGPTPVAPGGVIIPPATAPPAGVTYTLYDTDSNELYTTTGVYQPGAHTASYQQTTYQLFKGNSVTLGSTNVTCASIPPTQSLPCATINADGVVTQLGYDPTGDLISSSLPDGNGSELATTTYSDDADGEQTTTTAPDGNLPGANAGNYTTVTAFNADGEATSVTEGGGSGATVTPRITHYGYDADGNETTEQDPRGYTATTTYNADDEPTLVTDPKGNQSLTCYDGDGNITQTVPPRGVAASGLTAASCPTAYPSGYGDRLAPESTTYAFDANGNETAMTTPAPAGQSEYQTTTTTYDGDGQPIETTAPPAASGGDNQVTVDSYNQADELASQTVEDGTSAASTTSFCYDPKGDQTSVVMPDGNTSGVANCQTSAPWVVSSSAYPTQAAYQTTESDDSNGEILSTTSPATAAAPSGPTTTYTYDPAGNPLTSTDPNGITTTWTYTPDGLMASETYSGSAAHSVTYGYDASGNQTSMSDATGSSSYIWDPFGELTSATNGAGRTVSYGYDADGDTSSVTYPLPSSATWATSNTVSIGYNQSDVLDSVTDFDGNEISITNTSDSLPTSEVLGSTGDTITTSYDDTDSPSLIALKNSSATLQSFSYSDAPDGNILNETDTPSSTHFPATYSYDDEARLSSMTSGTGSPINYHIDASGNLGTVPSGASAQYNDASELTSSTLSGATTSYAYDADGDRLTAAQGGTVITSGTWNGAEELTSYANSAADMTSAVYDGNGLRASADGTSQQFTWDTIAAVPQLLMDSSNAYIYAGGNAPVEQVSLSTGTINYLIGDYLSSVRGTVNSSGSLTGTTSYDAYGNPLTSGGLTATTPFGYAGAYTDPTGLLYLLHRYYDPATGQFLSVDPEVSQTLSPYAYAGGNPITEIDPSGDKFAPPPPGGVYVRVEPRHKEIYQGQAHSIRVRRKFWIRKQGHWSFRVAKRIPGENHMSGHEYNILLTNAEQALFDAIENWSANNGWKFVWGRRPIALNAPDYKQRVAEGRKVLEKDGGLEQGDNDVENYTPTGPGGGGFDIPGGIIDSFLSGGGCTAGDPIPQAC